jgi:dolichol-phosphate mannosyltransferase
MSAGAARSLAVTPSHPKQIARGQISLGIVSPMANEAESAVPLVRDVLAACSEVRYAVFYAVLDHASHDGTRQLLLDYARTESRLRVIWAPENRCVVDAYVRGYKEAVAAAHDYILEIDAGFSHQPADIAKFLDALEQGYDCVFGSRFMPGGKMANAAFRRWLFSRGGSVLANALLGTRLRDMTSGFELFSRASLQMVLDRGIRSRAHFFQTEIKFYCRHFNIKEVPITYCTDGASIGHSVLGDAFRNLWRLSKLRWKGDTLGR